MKDLQEKKNNFIEQRLWNFNTDNKELIISMMDKSEEIIKGNSSDSEKISEMWRILTILAEQIVK